MSFGFGIHGHGHPPLPPTQNMLNSHPGPTSSPPQSVPGRRTPLGAVGIGGFYAQSSLTLPQPTTQTDENKIIGSGRDKSPVPSSSTGGKQKNRQGKVVRLNINAR